MKAGPGEWKEHRARQVEEVVGLALLLVWESWQFPGRAWLGHILFLEDVPVRLC